MTIPNTIEMQIIGFTIDYILEQAFKKKNPLSHDKMAIKLIEFIMFLGGMDQGPISKYVNNQINICNFFLQCIFWTILKPKVS